MIAASMDERRADPSSGSELPAQRPAWAWLAAGWAVAGVAGVLLFAIVRLSPQVLAAVDYGMSPWQWGLLFANVLFMAWSEGYRGFQCRFSPRVAARTLHLLLHPTWLRALLAPIFCIGYFHARKAGLLAVWLGTAAIVLAVLLVQLLPQPWRGILDAGVVVGLGWGLLTFLRMAWLTLREGRYRHSPGMPEAAGGALG